MTAEIHAAIQSVRFIAQHIKDADKDNEVSVMGIIGLRFIIGQLIMSDVTLKENNFLLPNNDQNNCQTSSTPDKAQNLKHLQKLSKAPLYSFKNPFFIINYEKFSYDQHVFHAAPRKFLFNYVFVASQEQERKYERK